MLKLKQISCSAALLAALFVSTAQARDDWVHYPIADVLNSQEAILRLQGVTFSFVGQQTPQIAESKGGIVSTRRTHALLRSDKEACERAMLNVLVALHHRALSMGGNAVVDIQSYYKNIEHNSAEQYRCGVGFTAAAVTLKGRVVKTLE